jgi:P-type conjugative transfer protein TrbL
LMHESTLMKKYIHFLSLLGLCILLFGATLSMAQAAPGSAGGGSRAVEEKVLSNDFFDEIVRKYKGNAMTWERTMKEAAQILFLSLATISLVWTFGFMVARNAEIGEFFSELVKFMIFTGLYWFFLNESSDIARAIITTFENLGGAAGEASGKIVDFAPGGILSLGLEMANIAFNDMSNLNSMESLSLTVVTVPVMVVFALIAINMLILMISMWIMAYAGIFVLGFGGSKWTSDMAVSYFKTLLGVAVQYMVMLLLIGIGQDILKEVVDLAVKEGKSITPKEVALVLVCALILLLIVSKVPAQIASMFGGGGGGFGGFGDHLALGAAANAGRTALGTAKMAGGAAMQGAGGLMALKAAFSKVGGGDGGVGGGDGGVGDRGWGGDSGGGSKGGSESARSGVSSSGGDDSGSLHEAFGGEPSMSVAPPPEASGQNNLPKPGLSGQAKAASGLVADKEKDSLNQSQSQTVGDKVAQRMRENTQKGLSNPKPS